jgi:putative PIN family toxin of toxin-antitoxin system
VWSQFEYLLVLTYALTTHQYAISSFLRLESAAHQNHKPKFDRYLTIETRRAILHDANAVAHWVDIPADLATKTYSRDPDDDKFIHTALASSAAWLVTGDQDLLVIETLLPMRILTAGEALLEAGFCYG